MLNKQNFTWHQFDKDEYFYKDLPRHFRFQKEIHDLLILSKFKRHDISFVENSFWVVENERIESFWLILKPHIQSILDGILKKNNLYIQTKFPVIHFRCSDVPFIKNIHYHLVRYSFYKNSLNYIKTRLFFDDTVILQSCNQHRACDKKKKSCSIYLDSLKKYLEDLGYKILIECNHEFHDFAKLFYAPAVISNGSSFAFMSGFFGFGIFISEGHFTEKEPIIYCYDCGSWLKHGYSILHKDVKNYHDEKDVIQKLTG
jgi:hypothetical protein